MKGKKEAKESKAKGTKEDGESLDGFGKLASKADLKSFLLSVRDRLADQSLAPIYAVTAVRYALNQPQVYEWLDNENKEMARDIWLRLKQVGLQLRNPPLLFSAEEDAGMANAE